MEYEVFESENREQKSEMITPYLDGYVKAQVIMWGSAIGLIATIIIFSAWYLKSTGVIESDEMW